MIFDGGMQGGGRTEEAVGVAESGKYQAGAIAGSVEIREIPPVRKPLPDQQKNRRLRSIDRIGGPKLCRRDDQPGAGVSVYDYR